MGGVRHAFCNHTDRRFSRGSTEIVAPESLLGRAPRLRSRNREPARYLEHPCERPPDAGSDVDLASSEFRWIAGCGDPARSRFTGRRGQGVSASPGDAASFLEPRAESCAGAAELETRACRARSGACGRPPASVDTERDLHLRCPWAPRPPAGRRAREDDRAAPSILGVLEAADVGQHSDPAGRQLPVTDRGRRTTTGDRPARRYVHVGPRRARDDTGDPRRLRHRQRRVHGPPRLGRVGARSGA